MKKDNRHNFAWFLSFFAIILIVASCQKNQLANTTLNREDYVSLPVPGADSNFVSYDDAKLFAERITEEVFQGADGDSTVRPVDSGLTIYDKNSIPAMYVFNYSNDKGYVILSADKRYEPVCAFGTHKNLPLSGQIPSMLGSWFGVTLQTIEAIREHKFPGDIEGNQQEWVTLFGKVHLSQLLPAFMAGLGKVATLDCNPYVYFTKGPLMSTTWGQNCTYNDYVGVSCTNPFTCYKAPAGCVATAGAQLLKYWALTNSNYDYANMPLDNGNPKIARLMADIGLYTGMNYGCENSNVVTQNLLDALQNNFYYSAPGDRRAFVPGDDRYIIKDEIEAGRPVLLEGCTDETHHFLNWEWGDDGNCHTWICDGYKYTGNNCFRAKFHFYMNWGWDSGYFNDWYYESDVWSTNGAYTYDRLITTGIHP